MKWPTWSKKSVAVKNDKKEESSKVVGFVGSEMKVYRVLEALEKKITKLNEFKGMAADDFHKDLCDEVDDDIRIALRSSMFFAQKDDWWARSVVKPLNLALKEKSLSGKKREVQDALSRIELRLRVYEKKVA